MISLNDFLKSVSINIDSYIKEKLVGEPPDFYESSLYILKAGGKRLRPALVFASGYAFGGSEKYLLPFAAGVELLHNFTLIHDDIMDNDDYRRGVPTVHKLWGIPTAILAGDLLFSYSLYLPLHSCDDFEIKDRCIKASKKLAWASLTVAEGQALDMSFEKKESVSEEEYMNMIEKKTAALIESSAYIGATIGGADEKDLMHISEFGRKIGIAFQIVDDILGIFGKEEETGKPVYSDIREGKKTLLIIRALALSNKEERNKLISILGKKGLGKEEYAVAARIIEELGVLEYANIKARNLAEEAKSHLDEIKGSTNKEYISLLKDIADLVVRRKK
ncbi:polyprenyl synthetase family protein [Fervidicoccus fontis]|uniref:Geranylgeranyl pyrophosphate synthetase n=2 Tax=Fervidicoccus fontis TaxID=683846 RepID=I0A0D7_FERFK|nr:polyprenyl synthetase family protein [Fervidicoccus fontis]AFH42444.1 Geranylgeranyl pyrophosphate synthetase [Fervidicoccus fontis Kam940]MBE9391058.1 polyprenyl synthetase family protein [Fervidicoccus fontis]PMB76060.1 MAG: octaprenyl diphosphate synthase [Fervidicoccus fontis]HEW63652.1 polyprenyl synthetase family protein [Fervidicoccus fontis]